MPKDPPPELFADRPDFAKILSLAPKGVIDPTTRVGGTRNTKEQRLLFVQALQLHEIQLQLDDIRDLLTTPRGFRFDEP